MSEESSINKPTSHATKLCIICEKPFLAKDDQQMCEHCSGVLSLFNN